VGSAVAVDQALRDILLTSRRNNPHLGVTGALMFNAGCFVQVLEGSRGAIDQVFQLIKPDKRHADVAVLSFGPVAERAFPNWSMAFVGAQAGDGRFEAFARESGYDPARLTGDATLEFLRKMVLAQEQAQAPDRLAG